MSTEVNCNDSECDFNKDAICSRKKITLTERVDESYPEDSKVCESSAYTIVNGDIPP